MVDRHSWDRRIAELERQRRSVARVVVIGPNTWRCGEYWYRVLDPPLDLVHGKDWMRAGETWWKALPQCWLEAAGSSMKGIPK